MHPSPLTGGFFTCTFYISHMNTPLMFRPVKLRLKIAYLIDTILNTPACAPGNTATRMVDNDPNGYAVMWGRIQSIYGFLNWGEMSDDEINDIYTSMLSVSTEFRGTMVEPMSIMRTKQRWEQRGWSRYEQRRNGRRTVARIAVVPVLACFGIVLPQ